MILLLLLLLLLQKTYPDLICNLEIILNSYVINKCFILTSEEGIHIDLYNLC